MPPRHPKIQLMSVFTGHITQPTVTVLFCSLVILKPRASHTMYILSPFISVLCHYDWLFCGESCPRLDVVHPGRAWFSSPAYTWHCSLHYLFLQATPLFPHGVTIVCQFPCFDSQCLTVPSLVCSTAGQRWLFISGFNPTTTTSLHYNGWLVECLVFYVTHIGDGLSSQSLGRF